MSRSIILLVGLFISTLSGGYSQLSEYKYVRVNGKEGLPATRIYSLHEDTLHQIYIGTDRGLFRYDGQSISLLGEKDGLYSDFIYDYKKDSKGRTWLLSNNNQLHYLRNGKINRVERDGDRTGYLTGSAEDADGRLYLGLFSNGYYIIDQDENVSHVRDLHTVLLAYKDVVYRGTPNELSTMDGSVVFRDNALLPNAPIRCINKGNKAYISLGKQLLILNMDTWEKEGLIDAPTEEIIHISDIDNRIHLGTRNGLYILEGNRFQEHPFNKVLSEYEVSFIVKNYLGEYLISTLDNGLFKFYEPDLELVDDFPKVSYTQIAKRKDGDIIAETETGKLINRKPDSSIFIKDLNVPTQLEKKFLNQYVIDTDTFEVLKSRVDLYSKGQKYEMVIFSRQTYYDPRSDHFYFSLYNGVLKIDRKSLIVLTKDKVTSKRLIDELFKYRISQHNSYDFISFNDDLIYGTDHGVYKINDQDTELLTRSTLFARYLVGIDDQYLAVATFNEGVVILDKNYTIVRKYDDNNSDLCSPFINELVYDGKNRKIYAVHESGYSIIDADTWEVTCHNVMNHLSDDHILQNIGINNNDIYLATNQGIWKTLGNIESKSFVIRLSQNSWRTRDDNIDIPVYRMDIGNTAEVTYVVEKDGKKEKFLGSPLFFRDLKSGKNLFKVSAYTDEGKISNAIDLEIEYHIPWYRYPPFYMMLFALLCILVWLGYRNGYIEIKLAELKERIIESLKSRFSLPNSIMVKLTDGNFEKISVPSILYIKASGNYLEIFTKEGKYLTRSTLKSFYEQTMEGVENLIQVHRSYIINVNNIKGITANKVILDEHEVPFSLKYKAVLTPFRQKLSIQ